MFYLFTGLSQSEGCDRLQILRRVHQGPVQRWRGLVGAGTWPAVRRGDERDDRRVHVGPAGAHHRPLPLRGRDQPGHGCPEREVGHKLFKHFIE